jgi:hypothetical protein
MKPFYSQTNSTSKIDNQSKFELENPVSFLFYFATKGKKRRREGRGLFEVWRVKTLRSWSEILKGNFLGV